MNFDYGNVLMRSLQITWNHKSFWIFAMLPMVISFIFLFLFFIPILFLWDSVDSQLWILISWLVLLFISTVIGMILGTISSASLTLGIVRLERGDGLTSFMALLRDGFPYFGRALGVVLIVQLTFGTIIGTIFLVIFLLSLVTMGLASICLQPIMLLVTPLSFFVVAIMDGALVLVVDENLGSWEAVKRASQVVWKHVWKFLILTLIVYFATSIVSAIFFTPAMIPIMLFPVIVETGMDISMFELTMILFACIFIPLTTLFSGVTGTFMTAVLELSYMRLAAPTGNEVVFASDEPKPATL